MAGACVPNKKDRTIAKSALELTASNKAKSHHAQLSCTKISRILTDETAGHHGPLCAGLHPFTATFTHEVPMMSERSYAPRSDATEAAPYFFCTPRSATHLTALGEEASCTAYVVKRSSRRRMRLFLLEKSRTAPTNH